MIGWKIFQRGFGGIILNLIKYLSVVHEDKLTETDHEILINLEAKLPQVPNLTISNLAEKVFTSSTSLHRLVKKLGFEGYTEFKYAVENYLDESQATSKSVTIDNDYFNQSIEDVKITYKLNEEKMDKVVKDLVCHDDLYCFGTGWKQKQIIDNFANDLLYYGHSFKTLRNIDDLRNASYHVDANSLVLIVSLSGDLKGYKDVMKDLIEKNITTIGVSRYTDNPLSKMTTHSLQFVDSTLNIRNHHWSALPLNALLDLLMHQVAICVKKSNNISKSSINY